MEKTNQTKFESWAVVQVFGHESYAGHVSEFNMGGASYLRIEVPEVQNMQVTLPSFVKLVNHNSVFDITPVSEEYAKEMAAQLSKHPITGYNHTQVIKQLAKTATEQMTMQEIRKLIESNTTGALVAADGDPVF